MDNTKLIAYAVESDLRNDPLIIDLVDALEAAEAELTRRDTLLRRAIQAGRDMHPIYGSTAACGGGIGGQVMTEHCAVVCENPKHDEAKEAWHQIEREFFALAAAPVSLEAVKAETTEIPKHERARIWALGVDGLNERGLIDGGVAEHLRGLNPWRPVETEGDNRV